MKILITLLFWLLPTVAHAQITYLATYEGSGTETDPFRAHSGIHGTECKSLRASEKSAAGLAYCVGPSLPARPGVINLSGKRLLVKADRDKILADTGIAVSATTVDGLLSELVDGQNVSLKQTAGRQRIVVKGLEVWSRPAPLPAYVPDAWESFTQLFLPSSAWAATRLDETFTCADDSDGTYVCDHTWSRSGGAVAEIFSNTLRTVNSVSTQRMRLGGGEYLDSTNMFANVEVVSIARGTATTIAGGPIIRHHATDITYLFCVAKDAATDEIEYGHVVTGSVTVDGAVSATVANGDIVEARAAPGDMVSCLHNGITVLGPTVESTGSGNLGVGLRFQGTGTATTTSVVLDNFHSGPLTDRRAIAPMVLQ